MQHALGSRIIGFVLSLILTLAAYYLILHPEFFQFDVKMTIMVIFALALVQSLVQLIFFIHVWKEDGVYWNLSVFISTVSIIFIIIYFSIWIIEELNYNMQ